MRPKILVSQLVRTFCGTHPSPIFLLILFSGWFVFAVCLAVDFKSAWGMRPNPGIQSSSQILFITLKKNRNYVNVLFLNNLLSQVRLNKTLFGQVKVRVKSTVILLLESFSKQLFISWKYYWICGSMTAPVIPHRLEDFIFRVPCLRNLQRWVVRNSWLEGVMYESP